MKGGGFLKSTITSILPIAGVIDEFKNFTNNNSKKQVETYVETTIPEQVQETNEDSTTEESTTEDSSEDELIDSYDPYDDLDIDEDEDEEMEFNLKDLLL